MFSRTVLVIVFVSNANSNRNTHGNSELSHHLCGNDSDYFFAARLTLL